MARQMSRGVQDRRCKRGVSGLLPNGTALGTHTEQEAGLRRRRGTLSAVTINNGYFTVSRPESIAQHSMGVWFVSLS